MDPNTIPTIIQKSLDILSAKFGTTGALLWQSVVTYTRFYAVSCIIGWFIGLSAIFISAWYWPKSEEYCDYETWLYIRRLIMVICIIVFGIVIGANFTDIVCPQGAVILQLISK